MDRLELVKRNTEEIVTEKELKERLKKKNPSVYLGTAITGRPHVAYFLWVLKLADFLKAGFKVTLLLADLHGALDNTPWDVLEKRYKYYNKLIPLMFKAIGADIKNFKIMKGSDFQLKKDYVLDVLKMSSFTNINDCKRAASEVVKFGDNPKLSGLIYPIMQAIDEVYLNVDMQYGGLDQRKLLMFARENLPKIGYKPRVEIMTPMIPGLEGGKMSASVESSKIDLLDDEKTVNSKVRKAYCEAGAVKDNGVLAFLEYVVLVIKEDCNKTFVVKRDKKYGGDLVFKNYKEIEEAFVKKELHPLDLKEALAFEINTLLRPIRKNIKELNHLSKGAYPK
ncbi:MAG: tyrosine--tRNA ligase [Candidatus Woesearchaeota archaeon]